MSMKIPSYEIKVPTTAWLNGVISAGDFDVKHYDAYLALEISR
jgi:hypothetical protein